VEGNPRKPWQDDIRHMNLVTGITGILGTHVAIDLLQRNQPVTGLIRPGADRTAMKRTFAHHNAEELLQQIEWIEGDVLDVTSLIDAVAKCAVIYHCAAIVSYHPADRRKMYKVNVEGTANVVNACIDAGDRILAHVSSIAAIGRMGDSTHLNEDSPWVETSHTTHYAITKHLSEMEVWRGIQEGVRAVILNSGFIIGPGDFSRSSASMFTRLSKGIPFYPPGGTGFISATDAARCLIGLVEAGHFGERFIAVSENRSMRDVFAMTSRALGVNEPTRKVTTPLLWVSLFAESMMELLTSKKAIVTREIIRNMEGTHLYENHKIQRALQLRFEPISEAITRTAELFLADRQRV